MSNYKFRYGVIIFLTILVSSFIFISCSKKEDGSNLFEKNGLIYNTSNHELFTGRIIDTSFVIIEFEVVNGVKNGRFTTYFLNGQTEKTGFIINNKNEGEWKYYYHSGQLKTIGNFVKDLPFGEWKFYFKNGKLKSTGIYINGFKYGSWSYFDTNGKLINRLLYRNGRVINIESRNT